MELSKLSLSELKRLKTRVETEIGRRSKNTRRDLLKKISKLTADAGLSLDDLLGAQKAVAVAAPKGAKRGPKKGSGVKAKVAPKYCNPANAAETWTGRGRKPLWVVKELENGKALDALLIK